MWKLGLRPRNIQEKKYINGIFVAVHAATRPPDVAIPHLRSASLCLTQVKNYQLHSKEVVFALVCPGRKEPIPSSGWVGGKTIVVSPWHARDGEVMGSLLYNNMHQCRVLLQL
jgi:hypothetical protein